MYEGPQVGCNLAVQLEDHLVLQEHGGGLPVDKPVTAIVIDQDSVRTNAIVERFMAKLAEDLFACSWVGDRCEGFLLDGYRCKVLPVHRPSDKPQHSNAELNAFAVVDFLFRVEAIHLDAFKVLALLEFTRINE